MGTLATRRRFLAGIGLLGGASLLAACGGTATTVITTASASTAATTTSASSAASTVAATTTSAAVTKAAKSIVTSSAKAPATTAQANGVTLQYLGQGSTQEQQIYQTLASNFRKANPSINLQISFATPGGASGVFTKLQTLVAANTGPDVYWTHSYIGSALYVKGVALVLDPLLSQDKSFSLNDYYAAAYLDYTFDNKHTALPREIATDILFYRTDLFDKAGVAYPTAKWTWDDFTSAGQKLTTGTGGGKIWGYGGPVTSTFIIDSQALENGTDMIDVKNLKSLFPTDPVTSAVQFLADLRFKQHVTPTADELKADSTIGAFSKGRQAMAFSGFYEISTIRGAKVSWNYDVANMPIFSGKPRASASATSAHSAWSGTKHQQEAWAWIKYLSGPEASKMYGASGLVIPPLKSVAQAMLGQNSSTDPKHPQPFLQDLEVGHPFPIVPNWIDVLNAITDMLAPVWAGKMSAKDAIAAGNAKVDTLLQQNAKS